MKHDLHMPEEMAQIAKDRPNVLRGYDPLREIYQWKLLALLFLSELLLIGAASALTYNSAWMLAEDAVWGIYPGVFVPFLLLLGTIPFLLVYTRYRKERQARAALRRQALMLHEVKQISEQSQLAPPFQTLPLPTRIECRRKKSFTGRVALEILLLVGSLLGNYIITLTQPAEPRILYTVVPDLLAEMIIGLSLVIWFEMRLFIVGRSMLPSLTIDDEAITARYGRSTITISWHNIRYFALVDSSVLRGLPTSTYPPTLRQAFKAGELFSVIPAPVHEVFEISDGQNTICWLKTIPLRYHRLFRFEEVALSDEDYIAFTQQLAALLVQKTRLPLYDLRIAK